MTSARTPGGNLGHLLDGESVTPRDVRDHTRASFSALQKRLAASPLDRWVKFFNMGYRDLSAHDPAASADHTLAASGNRFNADAARLVAELVSTTALDGQRVLDVGCGRGGALELITAHCQPRCLVGIDLSDDNIRVVRRAGFLSVHGDATALPLRPNSFDVVLNLESSQFYPDPVGFFLGVRSALATGGTFCYGDCFVTDHMAATREVLAVCGFDLHEERDVSANVLESRSVVGARQSSTLGGNKPEDDFVVAPGTETNRWLTGGELTYRLLRLRASGPPDEICAREAAGKSRLHATAELLVRMTQGWVDNPSPGLS